MINAEDLIGAFERNLSVMKRQLAGLTHEDCLQQPASRGNCMNWVLGHIADARNSVLRMLGQETVLTKEEAAR